MQIYMLRVIYATRVIHKNQGSGISGKMTSLFKMLQDDFDLIFREIFNDGARERERAACRAARDAPGPLIDGLGGHDGLLDELSELFEGERPEWMDLDLRAGANSPYGGATCQATPVQPERRTVGPASSVWEVPEHGDHRGRQGGVCCVHSMWHGPDIGPDPERAWSTHDDRQNDVSGPVCGTSLLKSGLLPVVYAEPPGGYASPVLPRGRSCFASSRRWDRLDQDNTRCCAVRVAGVKTHEVPPTQSAVC